MASEKYAADPPSSWAQKRKPSPTSDMEESDGETANASTAKATATSESYTKTSDTTFADNAAAADNTAENTAADDDNAAAADDDNAAADNTAAVPSNNSTVLAPGLSIMEADDTEELYGDLTNSPLVKTSQEKRSLLQNKSLLVKDLSDDDHQGSSTLPTEKSIINNKQIEKARPTTPLDRAKQRLENLKKQHAKGTQIAQAKAKLLKAKEKLVFALRNSNQQQIGDVRLPPPITALSQDLVLTEIHGPADLVRWVDDVVASEYENDSNDNTDHDSTDFDDEDDYNYDDYNEGNGPEVVPSPTSEHLEVKKKKSLVMHMNVQLLKKKLELKRKALELKQLRQSPLPPPPKQTKEELIQRQEKVQQDFDAAYWKRLYVQQRNLLRNQDSRLMEHDEALLSIQQELDQVQASIQECQAILEDCGVRDDYLEGRIQQVSKHVLEARTRYHDHDKSSSVERG